MTASLLLAAIGLGSAQAADWRLIREAGDVRLEYDSQSVAHDGPWILGWVRATYKDRAAPGTHRRGGAKVVLQRMALDCDANTIVVRNRLAYDQRGRLVDSTIGRPPARPFVAKPNTPAAVVFESACAPS